MAKKRPRKTRSRTAPLASFKIEQCDPNELLLDPDDPRLPPDDKGKGQAQLLEIMLDRFEISEIAESICSAGFLPFDPFVGCRGERAICILEGNRRLATIKLLLNPSLTPPRHLERWNSYAARLSACVPAAPTRSSTTSCAEDSSRGRISA